MSVIQFETAVDVENNLIRIPEQYIDKIPARVTVSFVDVEKPWLKPKVFDDGNANAWLNFLDALESIDEESPIEFERASLFRKVEI